MKAHYVLRVKANQPHLLQDLQGWFAYVEPTHDAQLSCHYERSFNQGHGRIETRQWWAVSDPVAFEYIRYYDGCVDLRSIAKVVQQRRQGDHITAETAYYISSLPNDAAFLLACSRAHWAVENNLRWVLDMAFNEDWSRYRDGNGAENMALLRKLALISSDKLSRSKLVSRPSASMLLLTQIINFAPSAHDIQSNAIALSTRRV